MGRVASTRSSLGVKDVKGYNDDELRSGDVEYEMRDSYPRKESFGKPRVHLASGHRVVPEFRNEDEWRGSHSVA